MPAVAFLDRARAILEQVERALATTRRTARGEQGRVAVGFTSSAPVSSVRAARHARVPRSVAARLARARRERQQRARSGIAQRRDRRGIHSLAGRGCGRAHGATAVAGEDVRRAAERPSARGRRAQKEDRAGAYCASAVADLANGDFHSLQAPGRSRPLRHDHHRLSRRRVQPACRPGSAAHHLDAQSSSPRGWGYRSYPNPCAACRWTASSIAGSKTTPSSLPR